MKDIEILAPAGSYEAFEAALYAGADAIYLGGSRFGARAYADNFDTDICKKAIELAHLYSRKIYVTTNTLVTNQEFESLYEMVAPLYEAGLDACIVQDLGAMSYLHTQFLHMDLHASTQMTLQSGRSANLLKNLGVTRFVPSRELTIQDIESCRRETDLEIEVFVHGALCYSYSGQCLMSSVIGGRSGNRGMCAQPCRLLYQTRDHKGYFLSPKDVCTIENIPDLVDAGIDSFKIEGRMKKKEYAALTAFLYRQYVDFYQKEGRETYLSQLHQKDSAMQRDITKLMDLFNRGGFCHGYLFEKRKEDIIFPKKNGHYGTCVGDIVRTKKNQVSFSLAREIQYQDVLEIRDKDENTCYEYTVKNGGQPGTIQETRVLPGSNIHCGDKVYRRRNNALLEDINAMTPPKVLLHGFLYARNGEPLRFQVSGKGMEITQTGDVVTAAKSRPVNPDDIKKRLSRTGDTEFVFEELEVDIEGDLFIPMGQLNEIRRAGLLAWQRSYQKKFYRTLEVCKDEIEVCDSKSLGLVVTVHTTEQLTEALHFDKINCYHLDLTDITKSSWQSLIHQVKETGKKVLVSFPFCLPDDFWFESTEVDGYMMNSWEMLAYVIDHHLPGERYLDTNLYVANDYTWNCFQKQYMVNGFTCHQDESIPVYQGGTPVIYGRIPVMTTKGCLFRTMGDCKKKHRTMQIENPKKDEFVVETHCEYCYNTIYTKYPQKKDITDSEGRIVFTIETPEEVRKVLKEWKA